MRAIGILNIYGDPNGEFLTPGGGLNIYSLNLTRAIEGLARPVKLFSPDYPDRKQVKDLVTTCLLNLNVQKMSKSWLCEHIETLVTNSKKYIEEFSQLQSIYTNYWLSGYYWRLLRAYYPVLENIPWFHSFHSLARVRNEHVQEELLKIRIKAEEMIIGQADCIIVNSQEEMLNLTSKYFSKPHKLVVQYGGYRNEQFIPKKNDYIRKVLQLPEQQKIVLFVGRFEERKGIYIFLNLAKAMQSYPQFVFVMVGGRSNFLYEQDSLEKVKKIIETENISNIRLMPAMPHQDLHNIYQSGDYIVLPSIYEPFGMTAIEAQGCGCIPIASNVGGLTATIVHGETGFLTDNSVAMYQHYLTMLEQDPTLKSILRHQAIVNVKKQFSWSVVAKQFVNLVDSFELVVT